MTDLDPVTRRRLDDMTAELIGEYGDGVPAEAIRDLMADSATRLAASAVVADYLPALAYRLTKERLLASERGGAREAARPDIVFVSLSGGGRGQIAAALTSLLAGERVGVHSAGTAANAQVDAAVTTAIGELGVDVGEAFARPITPEVLSGADVVVTMGHSVGLFEIPAGVRHEDWRVGDPVGAPLAEVRRVRADIERRVRALLEELGVEVTVPADAPAAHAPTAPPPS